MELDDRQVDAANGNGNGESSAAAAPATPADVSNATLQLPLAAPQTASVNPETPSAESGISNLQSPIPDPEAVAAERRASVIKLLDALPEVTTLPEGMDERIAHVRNQISVYFLATGENPNVDAFVDVRGMNGWREATFDVGGKPVRVAVASGLQNARNLVEAIRKGDVQYDFVEVMSCPSGCINGGGQPINLDREMAMARGQSLYGLDRNSALRFSHENPSIGTMYEQFQGSEAVHRVHELLHTDHNEWQMPLSPRLQGKEC